MNANAAAPRYSSRLIQPPAALPIPSTGPGKERVRRRFLPALNQIRPSFDPDHVCRLHYRKFAWLFALQDSTDIDSSLSIGIAGGPAKMGATNKCLARNNKSLTRSAEHMNGDQPTKAIVPNNKEKLNRTFAEVCASRNTIETVSLSRRNNCHANVCAPVELAPSRQATNGQRRYSCRALRSRYTPEPGRERKYD